MSRDASDRSVNLTEGDLLKPLVVLSTPIVGSQLLQVAYNLIDTFWVGRLGPDAVSALSFSFPPVFVLIGAGGGFAAAGTVLVAQHKGAGNEDRVPRVAGQTVMFALLLSLFVATVGSVAASHLLSLIGARPGSEIHQMAVGYTRTLFVGSSSLFLFFAVSALLRGYGDTRTPLYLMTFGVVLNVLIDPVFILGFDGDLLGPVGLAELERSLYAATGFDGFGVQGAAIATVLSRGLSALIGLGLLLSGRVGIHVVLSDLRPDPGMIRRIVEVGAPLSVEQGMPPLTMAALTAVVALTGPTAVAAFGIAMRLVAVTFLPARGFAQGTETLVGQNLGAGQVDRAKRGVLLSGSIVVAAMLGATAVAFFHADVLVGVFISGPDAASVVGHGADLLRIFGATFVFVGLFRVVISTYRGSGSTTLAMVFALVAVWAFRVPFAYLGLRATGTTTGIWYGMALGNVLGTLLPALYLLRGTWTEGVVESTPGPASDVTTTD